MSRRPDTSGGFTLLEISITLAILGVVMTLVYGVFSQTIAGKAHTEEVGEEFTSARAALARISQDLSSARENGGGGATPKKDDGESVQSPPGRAMPTPTPAGSKTFLPQFGLFIGRPRTEHRMPLDDVAFTATVRRPSAVTYAAADSGIVHYFVAPLSDQTDDLGLFREVIYGLTGQQLDLDRPDLGSTTLVLPNVVGLEFHYYDGKSWGTEWDSTNARNFAPSPFAVEVGLAVRNAGGDVETYRTAVDLPLRTANRTPEQRITD